MIRRSRPALTALPPAGRPIAGEGGDRRPHFAPATRRRRRLVAHLGVGFDADRARPRSDALPVGDAAASRLEGARRCSARLRPSSHASKRRLDEQHLVATVGDRRRRTSRRHPANSPPCEAENWRRTTMRRRRTGHARVPHDEERGLLRRRTIWPSARSISSARARTARDRRGRDRPKEALRSAPSSRRAPRRASALTPNVKAATEGLGSNVAFALFADVLAACRGGASAARALTGVAPLCFSVGKARGTQTSSQAKARCR